MNNPLPWRALSVLSDTEREILRLRVVTGLSAEQVAALLGCSPEAVRLSQHRALDLLRDELIARKDSSEDNGHGDGSGRS
ncbi:sigma factor-like helix-turn-helix DNA-binding protein [Lentzea aerocolonigenes]|uniref:sigma factor-like helix-turn-helix DNA-binding protein n=1 Tax=Lentzea aerocolonigenes TaxID=68170 RepID=UPI00056B46E7|nr:sigma factor-like helix-turn-helix DNA-binding protein [Lentzea aerocolonigenes]MCP2243546.1 RNA polymerase sigma factor, sigma-70 family [Lentzea aerocolonigenes]